jgi:hypothetical protein
VKPECGRRNGALLTILHKPCEVDQEIIVICATYCCTKEFHIVKKKYTRGQNQMDKDYAINDFILDCVQKMTGDR